MSRKIENMTPDQIAARGRELIKLARKKESELRQRELLQIGEIVKREISTDWASPWEVLQAELEQVLGQVIPKPYWVSNS